MATPLINGRTYDWSQIELSYNGTPIVEVTAIKYEDKTETKMNYGSGRFPTSYGIGKNEATASISLTMAEVEKLQIIAPLGRIESLPPATIIISYLNAEAGIVTHTLRNVLFTTNKRDIKTGDTVVEVELELMLSHIEWIAGGTPV